MTNKERIIDLVKLLNHYSDMYYNHEPIISDAEFDRLFDELTRLEKDTGLIYANSPTQKVGSTPVSSLPKVTHEISLLSLDKTKNLSEFAEFTGNREAILMPKLDGLTIKAIYEGGKLIQLSTRGNGTVGDDITHNAPGIRNLPLELPYKNRLVVVGEGIIADTEFNAYSDSIENEAEKPKNSRNLAAGSVRAFDPNTCKERGVRFIAFNVLEGFEDGDIANSKYKKIRKIGELGFETCNPDFTVNHSYEDLEILIDYIRADYEKMGYPLDGIVISFDDIAYSKSLGATSHHYNDGLAFKFEDEIFETILTDVKWTTSRSGTMSPVAIFEPVVIDGTEVKRASLHNFSFIKDLELKLGDRIIISKRNMIIPHIEDNLNRTGKHMEAPLHCPACGNQTVVKQENDTSVVMCMNEECPSRHLKSFVHFVSKKALDIDRLGESTLEKLIGVGLLKKLPDIFQLKNHEESIIELDGFGKKSFSKMIESIEDSRMTTFEKFIIALDIPLIGQHAGKILNKIFNGSIVDFISEINGGNYDFSSLEGFGDTLHKNIIDWFSVTENQQLFDELYTTLHIKNNTALAAPVNTDNYFSGKKIVITSTLSAYGRTEAESLLESMGATTSKSVSKKTDLVIYGAEAGSKLAKANELGVSTMKDEEFMSLINAN